MTPIEMMFDGVAWTEAPAREPDPSGLPYATHSGIWNFMGQEIRVYRLNTGQAIIHADDMGKILGLDESEPQPQTGKE